jgi:hypothetical protein
VQGTGFDGQVLVELYQNLHQSKELGMVLKKGQVGFIGHRNQT